MKATYQPYILDFKKASGTSRGVLRQKETWFLKITQDGAWGIGECGLLRGLSIDDRSDYESKLQWLIQNIDDDPDFLYKELTEFPSIQFGLETAFRSLKAEQSFDLFPSNFTEGKAGIPINGLIWMGEAAFMKAQIKERLLSGFKCIKMKIGAIDFQTELDLLKSIRKEFTTSEIELRVDANGAFSPGEALEKLNRLSEFELHSIEQPIGVNQYDRMAELCEKSPVPIALDEELIGVFSTTNRQKLLELIKPQYIILKPSFIGGFRGTNEWIHLAENQHIGWWVTSALESNVGLNAISQYTFLKNSKLPQGLGTGSLYTNNIPSPLEIKAGFLYVNPKESWTLDPLN